MKVSLNSLKFIDKAKFLIFAQHLELLNHVEALVQKREIDYIRIDGSISTENRHRYVQHFQESSEWLIAILSLTASSLGITMTAATNVIFAEVHWTPALMLQAEDRVHRIGQENAVNIYYLFGKETMDEIIFPVLTQKSHVIAETLDAKRAEYNLRMKAKQGLNQDEIEKFEREAIIRKRENSKKRKSTSSESIDKRINKYITIEAHHMDDIEESSISPIKSETKIIQPNISTESLKGSSTNKEFELSEADLMELIEDSKVSSGVMIQKEEQKSNEVAIDLQIHKEEEEEWDYDSDDLDSKVPEPPKNEADLYLEKLQEDDELARLASEQAVARLQGSRYYNENSNDISNIQGIAKPLLFPAGFGVQWKSASKAHYTSESYTKVTNDPNIINVDDIKNAFMNSKLLPKRTPRQEFKTLEQSLKNESSNDPSSAYKSEAKEAEEMTKMLRSMYDNQSDRSEESCYKDQYQLQTKEIDASMLSMSGDDGEGDHDFNEQFYHEIPVEYLDDDDKEQ